MTLSDGRLLRSVAPELGQVECALERSWDYQALVAGHPGSQRVWPGWAVRISMGRAVQGAVWPVAAFLRVVR